MDRIHTCWEEVVWREMCLKLAASTFNPWNSSSCAGTIQWETPLCPVRFVLINIQETWTHVGHNNFEKEIHKRQNFKCTLTLTGISGKAINPVLEHVHGGDGIRRISRGSSPTPQIPADVTPGSVISAFQGAEGVGTTTVMRPVLSLMLAVLTLHPERWTFVNDSMYR